MENVTEKMEQKTLFKTLVKKDHKFGDNSYVRGRISGIKLVLCDSDKHYANMVGAVGVVLLCECTPEEYDKFIEVVESNYPGLCEFNYEM